MRNLSHIPARVLVAGFTVSCAVIALAASAANDAPRWRPVRTEIPVPPVSGAFGPAVAVTEGRL